MSSKFRGHNQVLIMSIRGVKGRLPFIPFLDTDQVVTSEKIQFCENGSSPQPVPTT